MRQLTRQNLNNLFFAALIFILVVIGKSDQDRPRVFSYQETLEQTSVRVVPEGQAHAQAPVAEAQTAALHAQLLSHAPQAAPRLPVPQLALKAAYVKDLTTGEEFFNTSDHERWPIASLTKLMTAVIAAEQLAPDAKIPLAETAIQTEGASGNFKVGEQYTVKDLIKSMLVVSSNDAAAALADFYGETAFVELMQKKAATLNMFHTSFFDATGLSFINQSSVQDLEKLLVYIREQHPELLAISRTKTVTLNELSSGRRNVLANINYFASWPDFRGGKTGFIDSSGGNLLSTFEHNRHTILIIVLGADDRFEQTERLYNWVKQAFVFN